MLCGVQRALLAINCSHFPAADSAAGTSAWWEQAGRRCVRCRARSLNARAARRGDEVVLQCRRYVAGRVLSPGLLQCKKCSAERRWHLLQDGPRFVLSSTWEGASWSTAHGKPRTRSRRGRGDGSGQEEGMSSGRKSCYIWWWRC